MKEGAVAIIDALGFRGIWDRWPPQEVLANMHELKTRLENDVKTMATQLQFEASFLSDTIVLGLASSSQCLTRRQVVASTDSWRGVVKAISDEHEVRRPLDSACLCAGQV